MREAERLTRELFGAFARRDVAAAAKLVSENAVWRFPGRRGALAGDHTGRDAVFEFLTKALVLTDGSFHAEEIEIIADDRVAFFHFVGRAEREGRALVNDTCLRLEFDGGRLAVAQEWVWDLDHVEEFWG